MDNLDMALLQILFPYFVMICLYVIYCKYLSRQAKDNKKFRQLQKDKQRLWKKEHPSNCRYRNTRNGCIREDININFVVIGHTGTGKVRSYYNPTESEEKK